MIIVQLREITPGISPESETLQSCQPCRHCLGREEREGAKTRPEGEDCNSEKREPARSQEAEAVKEALERHLYPEGAYGRGRSEILAHVKEIREEMAYHMEVMGNLYHRLTLLIGD